GHPPCAHAQALWRGLRPARRRARPHRRGGRAMTDETDFFGETDSFADACARADAEQAARAHNLSSATPLHTWDAPDWSMLDERRSGDLPDFPANELGKAFPTLNRAAKGAGVTLDHVAVPMLGIASSLIGVARRVQASTSWLEPCAMWCAIVGYSGDGKTPGLDVTKRALAAVEREKRDAVVELQRKHDSKVEAARAARDAWKNAIKEVVENGGVAPEMAKKALEPGKFVGPQALCLGWHDRASRRVTDRAAAGNRPHSRRARRHVHKHETLLRRPG